MDALQEVLDLSVVFTKPPLNSPPEVLAGVVLRCEALGLEHTDDLFTDPLTQDERDDLFWYLEEYWKWPYLEFAERGKRVEALLGEVGRRLYDALFQNKEAQIIFQVWQQQGNNRHQISIVSEIAPILRLPWELLSDRQGPLALHTSHAISIVRRLSKADQTPLITPIQLPLRVLLVTARPEEAGFVDPRSISHELVDELQRQSEAGTIELEFLRPPTFAELCDRLQDVEQPPIHVLHFDGHGGLGGEKQQGVLFFETKDGKPSRVEASHLAKVLKNSNVRLAVLTACKSAMDTANDALSSVSTQLIKNGVGAVIAMSSSILVTSAALYVEAFYHALAESLPVSIAQEQARQALHKDPRRHLFRRHQDEEAMPVELHDWWVPHFYQQMPLTLQPAEKRKERRDQKIPQETKPALSAKMPEAPRYGFSGRSRELWQLERALLEKKLVVIHGFGGIGKTTLAREAADWFTQTGMYQGACFVSFEGGQCNANGLLSQLGFFLGIYDGTYVPDDPKKALQRLQTILKEQRTLVVADNLESILSGGEAPLETPERTELWDVLLDLQRLGAGVLLTSRDPLTSESPLAANARVMHLPLRGLHPDDAYALATRRLEYLGIPRTRVPYANLRDFLQQLDHHPLAIQLVLPTLQDYSLTQIQQDFVALLPRFTGDDVGPERDRSLLASLLYSLRRLSEEQRALLQRLSVFEGGVLESALLTITGMVKKDWTELRSALEQAALLTIEQLEGMSVPFLHFHPVFIPFLRRGVLVQDDALELRYAQEYAHTSKLYYGADDLYPLQIRAVALREVPNLRRAFKWFLEGGDLEQAANMAWSMDHFLSTFGLYREQQQMHRRLAEALATRKQSFAGTLTQTEYAFEDSLGEEEMRQGHWKSARARYQRLLARIESQPEGTFLGPGSFEHISILRPLGRCLDAEGNYSGAEEIYRRGLALSEIFMQHNHLDGIRLKDRFLAHLGKVLLDQGQYAEAKKAYEQALQIAESIGDLGSQAASRGQLGAIALEQRDYPEARRRYQLSLSVFHVLGEPATEAVAWHQLGIVAEKEQNWPEAERCYRESLSLEEQLGDHVGAAMTCNNLGNMTLSRLSFGEAKGWYQHAVVLSQQADPTSRNHASYLFSLAHCLVQEVQAGTMQEVSLQLEEAQWHAEQAMVIDQVLRSPNLWRRFELLATIAEMQGHHEEAHAYRRQEREAYASFARNRYQIEQQFGKVFPVLALAQDDLEVREKIEERLPQFEEKGWHISEALHRIWAGERDWQTLVENLRNLEALFVLRVLETIAESVETITSAPSLEQRLSTLPASIREALTEGDPHAFQRAFETLSAQEQQMVIEFREEFIQALQGKQGADEEEEPS